jgi:hypothetical protein
VKLGKDLTKQDHIVRVGGPGNGLNRDYYYPIEKDVNFIAERAIHTNVGFVNLFQRPDKPWMNGRVRSMNLWPHWALMGSDISHIGVIDSLFCERRLQNT